MIALANTLVFVLIVTNAGGEGKTTLAKMLQALWRLQGFKVAIISADPGNQAAAKAAEDTHVVPWSINENWADKIVGDLSGRCVILDLGANTMTSGHPIIDLIPALRAGFAAQGYRTVALMPLSTNKLAAADALVSLEAKITDFETVFVRVNRDGSGNYGDKFDPARTIDVAHLQPGFQALLQKQQGSWHHFLAQPASPYERAADYIVEWMRRFAGQPVASGFVGANGLGALDALGRSRPTPLRVTLRTLELVTDSGLAEAANMTRVMNLLDRHGWTPDGLEKAAAFMRAGQ